MKKTYGSLGALILTLPLMAGAADSKTKMEQIIQSVEGATQKFTQTGYLKKGENTFQKKDDRIFFEFEANKIYGILACGGANAKNVDLGLIISRSEQKNDLREGETAEILYRSKSKQKLQVIVSLNDSSGPGSDYTIWIGEVKLFDDLESRKLDMNLSVFLDTPGGKKTVTLREMIGNNEALYLRLWADWCSPCIALFPQLKYRAQEFSPKKIAVVAVENELWYGGPGGNSFKTKRRLREAGMADFKPYYEKGTSELYEALKINSVPKSLLLKKDGTILFLGHPMDQSLATALQQFGIQGFDVRQGR